MWAQLIKTRVKPGKDERALDACEALRAAEQPDSGLIRTTVMRDQKDPTVMYLIVVFESEEKARAREQDPRQEEGLRVARVAMAEGFEGSPNSPISPSCSSTAASHTRTYRVRDAGTRVAARNSRVWRQRRLYGMISSSEPWITRVGQVG